MLCIVDSGRGRWLELVRPEARPATLAGAAESMARRGKKKNWMFELSITGCRLQKRGRERQGGGACRVFKPVRACVLAATVRSGDYRRR